ncbi:response regulator [Psychrosphaera aquimarina]|uniref:Response regulator n=1 Tax=Psychrosphaera aquimarina TaxID=2044854 RepID=A0ABU3R099_9GAMM|nr:response regulator [Psychrosphaera aquimarina]MDU0113102.1 response regulator [Psychrosphaera aquimarina]
MFDLILVEDDLDDIYFFKMACNAVTPKPNLKTLNDGTELIHYLEQNSGIGKVILLDLNMPQMGGLEVLEKLNKLQKVNQLIIITYTTSDHVEDIKSAYKLGVKSYLTKPDNLEQLTQLVSSLNKYWFTFNLGVKETV